MPNYCGGNIWNALYSNPKCRPFQELPDTGIPREWERLLSSIFIVSPAYGTRASTVLLIGHDGHVFFEERRFAADGQQSGASQVDFDIEAG